MVFGNVIVVAFQSIFHAEMMFFLFLKNYFCNQRIKTIQKI